MSNYFKNFPTVKHDLKNVGQYVDLVNVMRRFKVRNELKELISVYHEYTISEGDRPDVIAEKYYGDSYYSWVVMLYNDIYDVNYDWPIFGRLFDQYVSKKYNMSIEQTMQTIKEYRWIVNKGGVDTDLNPYESRYLVVDKSKYDTLISTDRTAISIYEYEEEQNEKKRSIKILDRRYLPQLENEVKGIIREGL